MTEFEKVYRVYFDDVFRYILRLSGDETVAEEMTSDTFFKAMRGLESFRGDCDIRVWLCQIAKNCYFSYLKKQGRAELVSDDRIEQIPDDSECLEEILARRADAMQIQSILHGLAEAQKEVFMWRVFAELSFREIGAIFGKSENWACVTYHRAKSNIQRRLEELNDEK